MKTKKLYMVIEVKDKKHRLLASFNKDWFNKLHGYYGRKLLEYGDPGVDEEGFGWYEMNVPEKSTLISLGLGLDAADLYPLDINKVE